MIAKEIAVPVTAADFEEGDRVWYVDPKKHIKMFASVMGSPERRLMLLRDDGLMIAPVDNPDPKAIYLIEIAGLNKCLDVSKLEPGMKLSKRISSIDGFVVRVYAIVDEAIPAEKVVLRFHDTGKGEQKKDFTNEPDGDTIEYQMAGWEVEE